MRLIIVDWNLVAVEKLLCVEALAETGSIHKAAALLGITRDALKRRIVKHQIMWPRGNFTSQRVDSITLEERVDESDVTGERRASAGVSCGDRDKDGNLRSRQSA